MDMFDYLMTLGNANALGYWNSTLGWGYVAIKVTFYVAILSWLVYYLLQKVKNKYSVDIQVVGTNGSINEFIDTAKYVAKGTKIRLKRRRITIAAPEKKYITNVTGKFFIKGKIRLYQYGETEFSYTPIETKLNEDNSIKFKAIHPKLSMLESLNKGSRDKFADKKSMFITYAPVIIGLTFVAASFVMLLIAVEQIKPLLGSAGSLLQQSAEIAKELGIQRAVAVVEPVASGVIY